MGVVKFMQRDVITGARGELNAAAAAAEYAANAQTVEEEMVAVAEVMRHTRAIQLGMTIAQISGLGGPPSDHERLPLLDEGHAFGQVEARIPENLFWGLYHQKDFGPEGFFSDEGIRDLKRDFPFIRTKTVSGKTTVGWRAAGARDEQRRKCGARFGRGTIEFAK